MALTYWVSNTVGSDANDGLAPTTGGGHGPKATLTSGTGAWDIALAAGDTINVINTGTPYLITANRNLAASASLIGSSFTNFGAKIQGTDATGAPSLTKIQFTTGTTAIGLRSNQQYIIIQGFHVDRSGGSASSNSLTFVNLNKNAAGQLGPVRLQYCYEDNTATKSGRTIIDNTSDTTPNTQIEVQYCVVKDWAANAGIALSTSTRRTADIHHNVFIQTLATSTTWINFGADISTSACKHHAYNNTFVFHAGRSTACINDTGATVQASAELSAYSNLFVQLGATAGTDVFALGNAAVVGTGVRSIGSNVFTGSGTIAWSATVGPYQVPWDEDSSDASGEPDFWATDTTGSTNPFNASGTPYSWNANGAGWLLPLPGDYRLSILRTAGLGGTVPGAIADAITVAVDDSYGFYNDAPTTQPAPGVLSNDTAVGSGTAVLVSNCAAAAGSVSLSTDGSFTFTPVAGFQGTTTFTYKVDVGGGSFSNTATATVVVSTRPSGFSPSLISLDSPAFLFPGAVGAAVHLRRNTAFESHQVVDSDLELVTRVLAGGVTVAPSASSSPLPVLSNSRLFMLQPDGEVTLRINSYDVLVKKDGCVMVDGANLVTLAATNPSAVRTVNLKYFGAK